MTRPSKAALWRLGLGLFAGLALLWLLLPRGGHRLETPATPSAPQATPLASPAPRADPGPRLALILDDWGYNSRGLDYLPRYPGKLTVAVLPGLEYSRLAVEAAKAAGHQVILHMPMEAHGPAPAEASTLRVGMSREKIWDTLDAHFADLPQAQGLNNHEGSRASEDAELMSTVMAWLKRHDKFFVDSRTSPKSVGRREAAKAGVFWAERDVFLDHDDDPAKILAQLRRALRLAQKRGFAVAIGHPRPKTLAVLESAHAELAASGVRLVAVGDRFRLY